MSTRKRRILVLANETLEGRALRDVTMLSTDGGPPAEMLVVAPALNSRLRHWLSDEDEARRCAGLRLGASLERLRAAGIGAEGHVGDPTPLQAIADALHEFRAQEIVIVQREGHSHWLTRDLVGRARRRFAQPVLQIGVEPSRRFEPLSKSTTRRRSTGAARGSAAHRPREASA